MKRRRPWPSMESFSRDSRWRSEDPTTIGLYPASQSSLLSTSQVCFQHHLFSSKKKKISRVTWLSFSVGVVSTVVPDSPHKLFIGGLPNYLNDDQVINWKPAAQAQSCVLTSLSHAEVLVALKRPQNRFEFPLWIPECVRRLPVEVKVACSGPLTPWCTKTKTTIVDIYLTFQNNCTDIFFILFIFLLNLQCVINHIWKL